MLTFRPQQFAFLMATASEADAERARTLARLQATQQSNAARKRQSELAQKDREKRERWDKVIETHEKTVKDSEKRAAADGDKKPVLPTKPKVLQPVRRARKHRKVNRWQPRSMTFKKLLRQAAKIDTSSFKLGPKVKAQTKSALASPRPPVQPTSNPSDAKPFLPTKPASQKPSPPHLPSKSPLSASPTRSASPLGKKSVKKVPSALVKVTKPVTVSSTSSAAKDAKSRLRESFIPNQLIPLAQGPRRDIRTIEEAQTDLWRKKGKTYPAVTGIPKEASRVPASARAQVLSTKEVTQATKGTSAAVKKVPVAASTIKKRIREDESESDRDSFIAYSDEDEDILPRSKSDDVDYRAEIRALFSRNRPSSRVVDSDDDSDMEATGFEMEREEARAARLARMEDQAEEKRLEEHAREKKKRKMDAQQRRKV